MIKLERTSTDVLLRIPDIRKILEEDNNIVFAYLFGGISKGEIKPLSDVDIAVYLNSLKNRAEYKLDLFGKLADALGTTELDLVILNVAPLSLAGRILQTKQVIVDKAPFQRHLYESIILREFFDFRIKEERLFSQRYGVGR